MTGRPEEREVELLPPPGALVQSLRSLGYTPATAVADLIDNSITAGAENVTVDMEWGGTAESSRVTVADDGVGMNEEQLHLAMTPGSSNPKDPRLPQDLGRFGLGMKTASWSMGRRQTVRSVRDGDDTALCWDLDHVENRGKWVVIRDPDDPPAALLQLPGRTPTGTVVVVERCDKIFGEEEPNAEDAEAAFWEKVEETRLHLEMVFHRFLAGRKPGVKIIVNGNPCVPWDPFLNGHNMTQDLGEEVLRCAGDEIRVRSYVLPHRDHLDENTRERAAGPNGWNLQQGFYIYRAGRLIVSGGWFGRRAAKPEEHTKLARVSVDLTQEMDGAWHLNVLKSQARPPASLRNDFGRIGQAVRAEAKKAYEYRGKKAVGELRHRSEIPMWKAEQRRGGPVSFKINRKHDLVDAALDAPGGHKKVVVALLRHLERTVPVAKILIAGFEDEEQLAWDDTDLEKLSADAKLIYGKLRSAGFPPDGAKERLRVLQPFVEHPEIIEGIGEDDYEGGG